MEQSSRTVRQLSKMFNLIYNVGYIPSEWKLSDVAPIHKKDDKSSVENYRPISPSSLVMKVLECIMHEKLVSRTETKIDPRQHGFLKNKSCNTNLLSFTNSVSLSLHDKLGVDVIYYDFSKAFDTVSHDIILNKLKTQYNIDGALLKFFANYLQGRRQRVVLENVEPECVDILSGVPQGSILGPILFLLFINDICIGLNKDTNIGQYADDTKIWREIHTESDCAILQNDIDTLFKWSIKNKMKFHPDKCKVIQIHENEHLCTKVLPLAKFRYYLNSDILDYTEYEKDLRVLDNKNFKWDDHQLKVLNKAHQMLGITKRTCYFIIDPRKRRSLYLSLVRSQFKHCSSIWRPNTETEILMFEKLQKKAIKWIYGEQTHHYDQETYVNRCMQIQIIPMLKFFDINDLVLFHKTNYEKVPLSLPNFIQLHRYSVSGRLRQANLDSLSFVSHVNSDHNNTSCRSPFYKTFYYKVLHVWNSLPYHIRSIPDTSNFKNKIKTYFWQELASNSSISSS